MERCPNCGNKLSGIDVLCPKCGAVVEVIQAKINAASSEPVTDDNIKKPEPAQKKDIPKYFNVYYEGLPDEDSIDSESEAEPEELAEEAPESTDPPVKTNVSGQPGGTSFMNEEPDIEEEENMPFSKIVTAKVSAEGENDYSPRYLENLKNLDLPEIDDISNFDPEEYMREYKYKKILGSQAAHDDSQAAKKQWLEIEETENTGSDLASELTKVREDVKKQAEQAPEPQRRYRGAQDDRAERRRDSRPDRKPETAAKEAIQLPEKAKKTRRPRAAVMVLLWVLVSVAILFSSIYVDGLIKNTYHTYGEFIFSITNGQVDIDPGHS